MENINSVLVAVLGTVCTSAITAVLGPVAVAYVKNYRTKSAKQGGQQSGSEGPSNLPALAITSLVLGIFSLCGWLLPICGLPMSILGLIFGIASTSSSRRGLAIVGIVLCFISLIAGVANSAIGAYQGATGQLFRFQ